MAQGFPGESKERFWRRLLQEWRQSGQSVRAFVARRPSRNRHSTHGDGG